MASSGSWLMVGMVMLAASAARAASLGQTPAALALQASAEAVQAIQERNDDTSNAAFINGLRATVDLARAAVEVLAAWQDVQPVGIPPWASALGAVSGLTHTVPGGSLTHSASNHGSSNPSNSDSNSSSVVGSAMSVIQAGQSFLNMLKG